MMATFFEVKGRGFLAIVFGLETLTLCKLA